MAQHDDTPTAGTAPAGEGAADAPPSVRFSGGRWQTGAHGAPAGTPAVQLVPEFGVSIPINPFLERANTMEAFSKSVTLDDEPGAQPGGKPPRAPAPEKERENSVWRMSGIAVGDLFTLTADPKVQKRVMKADSNKDGRISRHDILKVMQSEATAKQKLKWGLLIGGVLLVFCLLMLAANAGLTYAVVSMSKETSVQTSGVMTNKDGSAVVGTAQAAETADLLYAYHTPAESASSLLSLKQLLITGEDGTMAAYSVLSATLVPGKRLEFVVAAPAADASGNAAVAELVRIVISDAGVHVVRSSSVDAASGVGRRLLTASSKTASITGQLSNVAFTASAATTAMSCPSVPTCGADGKAYNSPCLATQAGTTVRCTGCGPKLGSACPAAGTRPAGLPGNLAWDGAGYVRTSPPPPANTDGASAAAAGTGTKPTSKAPKAVRRPVRQP